MTPEEKIKEAKRLLNEATVEIRKREKLERSRDRCVCGHARGKHCVSYSINYTEGFCMHKGCGCKWFNMK